MGKKRTLASKRRQRNLLKKHPPIVEASCVNLVDGAIQENVPLDSEDEYDSFGSPG